MNCLFEDSEKLFSALSTLGTLAASLAAFYTILEMKRQRERSYRPEIVFTSTQFHLYSNETDELPILFSYIPLTIEDRKGVFSIGSKINLLLYNVGFGAAKNISFQFDFDLLKAQSIINNNSPRNKSTGTQKINVNCENDAIYIDGPSANSFISINRAYKISVLLPSSNEYNIINAHIPIDISTLFSAYCYVAIHNRSDKSFLKFPPINLVINYQDISDKVFQKKFEILLTFRSGTFIEYHNEISINEIL